MILTSIPSILETSEFPMSPELGVGQGRCGPGVATRCLEFKTTATWSLKVHPTSPRSQICSFPSSQAIHSPQTLTIRLPLLQVLRLGLQ